MEHLRRHDFVVGLRIHGAMLAIQAGVPAMCVTHDSRTEELCQTMGIPYVPVERIMSDNLDVSRVLSAMEFNPDEFDRTRRQLARRYRDVLSGSGIRVPGGLDRIAGGTSCDEVSEELE